MDFLAYHYAADYIRNESPTADVVKVNADGEERVTKYGSAERAVWAFIEHAIENGEPLEWLQLIKWEIKVVFRRASNPDSRARVVMR